MKKMDLGKMQEGLNDFLKKKYGDDVSVSIGANIITNDKLNEKQKEIDRGIDKQEGTK